MSQTTALATCADCNYNFPAAKMQKVSCCPNCNAPANDNAQNELTKAQQPKLLLIGVAAKARSGKSTVTKLLAKLLPPQTIGSYSFADPIKKALSTLLNVPLIDFEKAGKDEISPELGFSIRHAMQTLGTEWGREMIHPDIWVKVAKSQLDPSMLWIISDVRYENEAAFIRENGVLIHLYRDDAPQVKAHSSENGVSVYPGDFCIYNNGSLEDLDQSVAKLVPQITQILAAQEDAYA